MLRESFNEKWKIKRITDNHHQSDLMDITLPYDAMIHTERHKDSLNGSKKAYFENGIWEYYKIVKFDSSFKGKNIFLEFEGVYQNAKVFLNGLFVKSNPYGYSEFVCDITDKVDFEKENVLKVICSTGDDSRWYSGAGIYRDVNLLIGNNSYFEINGIKITTKEIKDDKAVIEIKSSITNLNNNHIRYEIYDKKGSMVKTEITKDKTVLLTVDNPFLWDESHPDLYTLKAFLVNENGETVDESAESFGIRTISVNSQTGLLVNGKQVKLRGACIHHDNGVIGANSYYSVEYRKIRKLKEAGFNALRIAHHPAGRNILKAADELGMYVMEESFDAWQTPKSYSDYSLYFDEWYQRDLSAMVDKDYNHPSVIMYCVGNEIADLAFRTGQEMLKKLTDCVHSLDNTRFVTCAINNIMLVIALSENRTILASDDKKSESKDVNQTMSDTRDKIKEFTTGPISNYLLSKPGEILDIVGYNYMPERYGIDRTLHEERVIVGSETYPKDIAFMWDYIKGNNNVIGDFTWTGWDYLGETGIGKITYKKERDVSEGIYGDYPYITAFCGDLDITGQRLPVSYYREIVFGLRKKPYIAIHNPDHFNEKPYLSLWSFDDVDSYYDYKDNQEMKVDVYSNAREVTLYINGKQIGKEEIKNYKASFICRYKKGEIKAVDENGNSFNLYTPEEEKVLRIEAENDVIKENDLIFINISMEDKNNIVDYRNESLLNAELSGNLELLGFGNGSPVMENEKYDDLTHHLYHGRAFMVLKAIKKGKANIKINNNTKELNVE